MEVLEKELEACLVVFRVQVLGVWMIWSRSKVSAPNAQMAAEARKWFVETSVWWYLLFPDGRLGTDTAEGQDSGGKEKKKKAKSQIEVFYVAISSKLESWRSGQVFIVLLFLWLFCFCLFVCFGRFSFSSGWP